LALKRGRAARVKAIFSTLLLRDTTETFICSFHWKV